MILGKYTNGQRVGIGAISAALVLIGTIVGGVWAAKDRLDEQYVNKAELRQLEYRVAKGLEEVLESIKNLSCATIRQELNDIAAKESNGELTEYDKARRNDLELQWERQCLNNDGSRNRSS